MALKGSARRILFVAPPGYGHLFPLIPLAWACRGAGHHVRFATCGISVNGARRAGLDVADVAPEANVAAILDRHKAGFRHAYPPQRRGTPPAETTGVFAEVCDAMADGTIDVARRWPADVIVYAPEAASALVAATLLRVPAAFVSIGLGHTPALMAERYAAMRAVFERRGVSDLVDSAAWIDLSPPSLRQPPSDGWPMRYIQYNGGDLVARAPEATGRPRIAVTFGTMVPFVNGLAPLRRLADVARGIDATFVIAHGSASAQALGPLPPNVEASSWIGLDGLIASCSAAIHHGGFGTTLAIASAGLPQMILPQGADQFYNASAVERQGAALVVNESEIAADAVRRLLDDPSLREAARSLQVEITSMPPPSDVVPRLAGLAD